MPLSSAVQRLKHNDINAEEPLNFADHFNRSNTKVSKISRPSSRRGSFAITKGTQGVEELLNLRTIESIEDQQKPELNKFDSTFKKFEESMQDEIEKHEKIIESHLEDIKKKMGK